MSARAGMPRVVSVVALDGHDESTLLELAASLARGLEPALAAAILDSAREREVEIYGADQFHATTGRGVAASVAGRTVVLGDAALFRGLGLSVDRLGDWAERLRRHGQRVLFVAVDGRTAGFLGVANTAVEGTAH